MLNSASIHIAPWDGATGLNTLQVAGDIAAVIIAGCAVAVSVMAYRRSASDAAQALRLQSRLAVNDQMSRYLDAYLTLVRSQHITHSVKEYIDKDPAVRLENQLVVGQLIMLVEAMFAAGDERGKVWSNYIGVMEGPLWDQISIETYASSDKTRNIVVDKQNKIRAAKPYDASLFKPVVARSY